MSGEVKRVGEFLERLLLKELAYSCGPFHYIRNGREPNLERREKSWEFDVAKVA